MPRENIEIGCRGRAWGVLRKIRYAVFFNAKEIMVGGGIWIPDISDV